MTILTRGSHRLARLARLPPFVQQVEMVPEQNTHQSPNEQEQTHLVFPGGGIFFYWQAGAVSYLRDAGYDLSTDVKMSGASAGAITATLSATEVDFDFATEVALELGREAGVWTRRLGLIGIWGGIIDQWLDIVLPEDAVHMANERLSLLLTPFPSIFGKQRIAHFDNRTDLIKCNMASLHLPLFLDGRVASKYRNQFHIDGSFLARPADHFPDAREDSLVVLDFQKDPLFTGKKKEFVKLISEPGILSLVQRGKEYAEIMDKQGAFNHFRRRVQRLDDNAA